MSSYIPVDKYKPLLAGFKPYIIQKSNTALERIKLVLGKVKNIWFMALQKALIHKQIYAIFDILEVYGEVGMINNKISEKAPEGYMVMKKSFGNTTLYLGVKL